MRAVELSTLQNGVVIDMFNEEFEKILENIADDNVMPDATRELTIKVRIKPDKTRRSAVTKIDVTSKLAPVKSSDGMLFISNEGSKTVAYEDDYEQKELEDEKGISIFKMPKTSGGEK